MANADTPADVHIRKRAGTTDMYRLIQSIKKKCELVEEEINRVERRGEFFDLQEDNHIVEMAVECGAPRVLRKLFAHYERCLVLADMPTSARIRVARRVLEHTVRDVCDEMDKCDIDADTRRVLDEYYHESDSEDSRAADFDHVELECGVLASDATE